MKNYLMNITFVFFLLIIGACSNEIKKPTISFYHWQSYFDISSIEYQYLDSLKVDKLYLRYFDVDKLNNNFEAIGKIVNQLDTFCEKKVIPTIFITNRTFKNVSSKQINDLVNKVFDLIKITHTKFSDKDLFEIQFDCDWSTSTKDAYFSFLSKFKEKSNLYISTTIRLHQVKYYKKTGIPPADKFVLMCYNMGEVSDIEESNSILQPSLITQYLKNHDYPKKLEIAMPLFSWGVLFREGKIIKLIRNINQQNFKDSSKFKINKHKITVLESTYLKGYYLYKEDQIRLEEVSLEMLSSSYDLLKKYVKPNEIIYYHLDNHIIKQFPYDHLQELHQTFIDH